MARGLCVAQDYLAYGYVAQARQPSITLRDSKPVNYAVLTRDEHSTFRRQPPRGIPDFWGSWRSPVSSVSPARRRLSCEVALVAGVLFFAEIRKNKTPATIRAFTARILPRLRGFSRWYIVLLSCYRGLPHQEPSTATADYNVPFSHPHTQASRQKCACIPHLIENKRGRHRAPRGIW